VSIAELLVKPELPLNIPDLPSELMRIVNTNGLSASKSSVRCFPSLPPFLTSCAQIGRHLVDPGKIGLINHNGQVQIVGPGRWMVPNPRATWVGIYDFLQNVVHYESMCIVRVQKVGRGE
jgi:hypothetical protein